VAAVYQRQLSVPSLRGRLMSTSESWGVNGHTTRCTIPVSVVVWLRLVSGWGLLNGDQPLRLRKWLYSLLLTLGASEVYYNRPCLFVSLFGTRYEFSQSSLVFSCREAEASVFVVDCRLCDSVRLVVGRPLSRLAVNFTAGLTF